MLSNWCPTEPLVSAVVSGNSVGAGWINGCSIYDRVQFAFSPTGATFIPIFLILFSTRHVDWQTTNDKNCFHFAHIASMERGRYNRSTGQDTKLVCNDWTNEFNYILIKSTWCKCRNNYQPIKHIHIIQNKLKWNCWSVANQTKPYRTISAQPDQTRAMVVTI